MTCCSIVLLTILRTWVFYNKTSTPSQNGSQLHLTLNISKTKYMIISRSYAITSALRCNDTPLERVREHTVNGGLMEGKITSLFLNNDFLEEVSQFKYLGVTITDDLSWSKQVSSVVSKARRILGMIYHKFYRFCGTSTLLRLYKAYVKPHLE